jgi:hypothetical protein
VGSISPQPGTSQIPQEIGAEATRDKKSDNWDPFVGTFQKYARIKALSATPQ